jgi:hypothetical protein
MNRILGSTMWILAAFFLLAGCEAPGVGDPCTPEAIPSGGFVGSEAYLETSSVQCRTRVCMVYKLMGVPFGSPPCETLADVMAMPTLCADERETYNRVYCTCRCDAPAESTATLCDCPEGDGPDDEEGFSCVEVIDQEGAGLGIRGSYCVRNRTFTIES